MLITHITTYPGVTFKTLKKVFVIPDSTLRYHLNYLEKKGEIKTKLESNQRCYYPVDSLVLDKNADMESTTRAKKLTKLQERIIFVIKGNPWISQKDLATKTKLKRFILKYYLKRLIEFGIVQRKKIGREVCYRYISEKELRKKVLRRLILKVLNNEIDEHTFIELKKLLE
jgi:predicted transcriptional regulator